MPSHEPSELAALFGAYLHQDFDLAYGSQAAAIRAYRDESTPAQVRAALGEIDALLDAFGCADDDALARELRALGFGFYPPRDGETTAQWLRRARAIIASRCETDGRR